jgi:hypothetical protein
MAFLAPLALAGVAGGGATLAGAGLGTALSVGSGIFSGVSAIQQGNYQAAVAKNNAVIAAQNAGAASDASQREGVRSDLDYAAAVGEVVAAQGASGLDILGRTQIMGRNRTRQTGREAAMDIRGEGTNHARGLMQDAANFRAQGRAAKSQGWASAIGSFAQAGSDLSKGMGWTSSLATSGRKGGRRPWDSSRDWSRG